MRAWVNEFVDGREKIPGNVTGEYKTRDGMFRNGVKPFMVEGKVYVVAIHYNFELTKYGPADETVYVELAGTLITTIPSERLAALKGGGTTDGV